MSKYIVILTLFLSSVSWANDAAEVISIKEYNPQKNMINQFVL